MKLVFLFAAYVIFIAAIAVRSFPEILLVFSGGTISPPLQPSALILPSIIFRLSDAKSEHTLLDHDSYAGNLVALKSDGRPKWKFQLANSAGGIRGAPASDDDTVYFGGSNGVVYAVDKSSGELRWSKQLGHTINASVLLRDGFLYLAIEALQSTGYLVKLQARDGSLIWTTNWLNQKPNSSPSVSADGLSVEIAINSKSRLFSNVDGQRIDDSSHTR